MVQVSCVRKWCSGFTVSIKEILVFLCFAVVPSCAVAGNAVSDVRKCSEA